MGVNKQMDIEGIKTSPEGKKYSGMSIGQSHNWNYTDCQVHETKIAPDKWHFKMTSIKRKQTPTTHMGNINPGTQYHWYFIGEQKVTKIDENSYQTELNATKYKIGHKRPYWQKMSYQYEDQIKAGKSENQMKIAFLNQELQELAKKMKNNEPGGNQT